MHHLSYQVFILFQCKLLYKVNCIKNPTISLLIDLVTTGSQSFKTDRMSCLHISLSYFYWNMWDWLRNHCPNKSTNYITPLLRKIPHVTSYVLYMLNLQLTMLFEPTKNGRKTSFKQALCFWRYSQCKYCGLCRKSKTYGGGFNFSWWPGVTRDVFVG